MYFYLLPHIITYFSCVSSCLSVFTIITRRRRYSFADYWKHFVARLNGVHAFGYNSTGSERIWMKFGILWVHCLPLTLAYFGRDPRRSESERATRFFCLFLWGKQRAISPTSGRPNFKKFGFVDYSPEDISPEDYSPFVKFGQNSYNDDICRICLLYGKRLSRVLEAPS